VRDARDAGPPAARARTVATKVLGVLVLVAAPALALAGPAMDGVAEKQPLNVHAIAMLLVFVAMTMGITYWAARRTRSTADFCSARRRRATTSSVRSGQPWRTSAAGVARSRGGGPPAARPG
jgi:quinol-cytochrome oxidoreductase complex cytochrome b subunit